MMHRALRLWSFLWILYLGFGTNPALATPHADEDIVLVEGYGTMFSPLSDPGDHLDYLAELGRICQFLDFWQVKDTEDPEFGGMSEDEFRTGADRIVESDNTQESIYVFCRYYELTGDNTYAENIQNAWIYLQNNPAWQEIPLWYGIWNCGWGLQCSRKYGSVYQDDSFVNYAEQSATLIMENDLPFDASPPREATLNVFVMSWAVWNLFQYGIETGNTDYINRAIEVAQEVKTWLESDPANLGRATWALSGGIAATCVLDVVFADNKEEAVVWRDTFLSDLIIYYDPAAYGSGAWLNAWDSWQALAQNALWRTSGDFNHRRISFGQSDANRSQDSDADGGIPANPTETNEFDQTWVTTYIVLMGLAGLDENPDLRIEMPDTSIEAGDRFLTSVQIYGPGLDQSADLYIFVEIGGIYYAYPSADPIPLEIALDFDLAEFAGMTGSIPILDIPSWPEGIGVVNGSWLGALTEHGTFNLIGDVVTLEWHTL